MAVAGVRMVAGWKLAVVAAVVVVPVLLFAALFMAAGGAAQTGGVGSSCTVVAKDGTEIPAKYIPWLEKAAVKYKLGLRGFSIVAAIHEIESDFGRLQLPGVTSGENFAGAGGPGQFLAATWDAYGVDADGDGERDRYSIPDSVFATANYLRASGAPKNWHDAIFAYNHAEWYVEDVLRGAEKFDGQQVCTAEPATALGPVEQGDLEGLERVAKWIESKKIHYCWGGGHAPEPGPSYGSGEFCPAGTKGLDCSGSVRWLLVLSGYPDPGGLVSNELGAQYEPGPGKAVTIWSNAAHIWIEINGKDWGTSSSNFAHGPAFGTQVMTGFVATHPKGL